MSAKELAELYKGRIPVKIYNALFNYKEEARCL